MTIQPEEIKMTENLTDADFTDAQLTRATGINR